MKEDAKNCIAKYGAKILIFLEAVSLLVYLTILVGLFVIIYNVQNEEGFNTAFMDVLSLSGYLSESFLYIILVIIAFLTFCASLLAYRLFFVSIKKEKYMGKSFLKLFIILFVVTSLILIMTLVSPSQFSTLVGFISILALLNQMRLSSNIKRD